MNKTSKAQPAASLDNLKPLLEERALLQQAKKRLEAQIEKLDKDIRPVLAGRGAVVYNGFQFEVGVTAGRTTYDYKAMEADGVDLELYKKVGSPSTRFTIKEVNEL